MSNIIFSFHSLYSESVFRLAISVFSLIFDNWNLKILMRGDEA